MHLGKTLLLSLAAAGLAACGSDSNGATGPLPRNCTKGTLTAGDTKTGTTSSSSCLAYDYAYSQDSTYYDAYDVHLDAGKAYVFTTVDDSASAGWDSMLELWVHDGATGEDRLVAISDDDGVDLHSQLAIVAPVTGTFSLRVQGYDIGDTSRYVLRSTSCAVTAIGDQGTVTTSVASSDCVLEEPAYGANDSVRVKFFRVHVGANETRNILVRSAAFHPGFSFYGPAWGMPCWFEYTGCGGGYVSPSATADSAAYSFTADGWNSQVNRYGDYPGDYTLIVGGTNFADVGSVTVTVTNPAQTQPVAVRASLPMVDPLAGLSGLAKKPIRR